MYNIFDKKLIQLSALLIATITFFGCGGSDDGEEPMPPPTPVNQSPTVDAGADTTVDEESVVTVTATGTDADGTITSYVWTQTSGSAITLTGTDSSTLTFTAPNVDTTSTFTFEVTVTDNDGDTATDSITITVSSSVITGVLLDSPVINVAYETSSGLTGTTNESGEFSFRAGDTVDFSIGNLEFETVTASTVVTPLDIAGTQDITDPEVVNIIRLLQTLDEDGNPDNGITISAAAVANSVQLDFEQPVEEFKNSIEVQTLLDDLNINALISEEEALSNFAATLEEESVSFSTLAGAYKARQEGREEDANSSAIINLFPDNTFWLVNVSGDFNPDDQTDIDAIGFEFGVYEVDPETQFITFDVLVDFNNDTGFCNELTLAECDAQPEVYPFSEAYVITENGLEINFIDDAGGEEFDATVFFDRLDFTPSTIEGTWTAETSEKEIYWTFNPDGSFVYTQYNDEDEDQTGFATGNYVVNGDSVTLTIINEKAGSTGALRGTIENPVDVIENALTDIVIGNDRMFVSTNFDDESAEAYELTRQFPNSVISDDSDSMSLAFTELELTSGPFYIVFLDTIDGDCPARQWYVEPITFNADGSYRLDLCFGETEIGNYTLLDTGIIQISYNDGNSFEFIARSSFDIPFGEWSVCWADDAVQATECFDDELGYVFTDLAEAEAFVTERNQ